MLFLINRLKQLHKFFEDGFTILSILLKAMKKKHTEGLMPLCKFLISKTSSGCMLLSGYLIAAPIVVVIIMLRPAIKIRLVRLRSSRIGHYSLDTELMLCNFNIKPEYKKYKTFFYTEQSICNSQLHKMFQRTIPIIPLHAIAHPVNQFLSFFLGESYKADLTQKAFALMPYRDFNFLFTTKEPNVFFLNNEETKGKNILCQIGVPNDAKFVCLLVRDQSYLNHQYPDQDWDYTKYRDADIDNYKRAALYLVDQGYYVLRMGKCVNKTFSAGHSNIIDYANHALRSDFMDIYLSSKCDFFISTSCGLDSVALMFRRPVLLTNFADLVFPYGCCTAKLVLPKKIRNIKTGRILSFKEMISILNIEKLSALGNSIANILHEEQLEFIENTENELLEIVKEMINVLAETGQLSDKMNIQKEFWSAYIDLFRQHGVQPPKTIMTRIGSGFLNEQKELIN